MSEKETDVRREVLQEIRQRIAGCFGDVDKIFNSHHYDEQRSKEFRSLAKKSGILPEELQQIAIDYLRNTGFPEEHITKQTKRITKYFSW